MVRDSAYWAYKRILLLEQSEYLTEAERQLAEHNVNLIIANQMAHSGSSADDVHHFLSQSDSTYQSSALMHWYRYGGDLPVHNFLRHAVSRTFGTSNAVRHSHFEGVPVHNNCIHSSMQEMLRNFHKVARPSAHNLPDKVTVYRGVGLSHSNLHEPYTPHAIESWTTDLDTANAFSKMSHLTDSVPCVFRATVARDDVFTSHHASVKFPHIIPPDNELLGKQEIIPFGHKLTNIERIA